MKTTHTATTTATTPAHDEARAEKLAIKKAKADMKKYVKMLNDIAVLKASIETKLDKLAVKAKALSGELVIFGEAMRSKFDKKGHYDLGAGYLHISNVTNIIYVDAPEDTQHEAPESFDIVEFAEDFPDLVEMKLKLKPILDVWTDDDQRTRIQEAGVSLKKTNPIQVKINK